MNDPLLSYKLFVRVARAGSFSKAARDLNLSQPSVSRVIASLEEEVGVQLLTRSTRAVVLTEAGADFLERIEPLLSGFEEAHRAAKGTNELLGTLRVALPTSIAIREVIPRLEKFMARHPKLRIDLIMEDYRQDLLREGVDIALRFGDLRDSSAVARKVGTNHRVLAAAPGYLDRAGWPQSPSDLADHAVIIGPPGNTIDAWRFSRDGKVLSVRVEGRLHASVNECATAAAVAGLGIVSTGWWGCRRELEAGTLVQILPEWILGESELHAVLPAGRTSKPAARLFADYLIEEWVD